MSEQALFGDDEMSAEETELLKQQQSQDTEDKAAAEAEAAEKAVEEPDETTAEEPPEEKKEAQRVPLGDLLDERKARQHAQREAQDLREKYAKLDGRLEELSERFKAPVEQAPSVEEDPVGHIAFQNRQLQQEQAKIAERLNKRDEEGDHAKQWQDFQSAVAADEQAYRAANPEQPFDDALAYLRTGRDQEYQAMGIVDPVQRQQLVARDEVFVIQQAMSQGKSPTQAAWDLASARGYQPKPETETPSEINEAGRAIASAIVGEGDKKIAQVAKGQAASTSLSSAGGGAEVPLSLEAISQMTDEEFAKIPESEWRRMMGAE